MASFGYNGQGNPGMRFYVASTTYMCCNNNMGVLTGTTLDAITQRRAIRAFDPVPIPPAVREQLLDAARLAPSSFNSQPYRFYWVESSAQREIAGRLCMGQKAAVTASALVVAVADLGSLKSTSQQQLKWMRANDFPSDKLRDYARTAKIGRILFAPGPFGLFAAIKWLLFRLLHCWKIIGMPPLFRKDRFKWATKNTALACENLMIAAEALDWNSCPMEGFDGRRLSKFLGLSPRVQEIVMVIAVGKKSSAHREQPQWRRPLESTVTIL
jgi:nitroreductase